MKHQTVTAHPLCWPEGWTRTPAHGRQSDSVFSTKRYDGFGRNSLTFDRARRSLADELERLRAKSVVVSSNVPLRIDGQPSGGAGERRYDDPGIAVYFQYKGRPMVMAADRYTTCAGNMRSLALAIDALRTLERHGGGVMMERAFSGFTALPPPDAGRELLSVREVEARFQTLAKRCHPDVGGGSTEAMAELNQAKEDAVADLGGAQ